MKQHFIIDIAQDQIQPDGTSKKVISQITLEAVNYTDAETRVAELAEDNKIDCISNQDCTVRKIAKIKLSDVLEDNDEGETYYKVKTSFVSLDESAGKEKKIYETQLVRADSVEKCLKFHKEVFSEKISVPYQVESINPTKVTAHFPIEVEVDEY